MSVFKRASPKLNSRSVRSNSNIIIEENNKNNNEERELQPTESTTFPRTFLRKTFSKILPPKTPPVGAEEEGGANSLSLSQPSLTPQRSEEVGKEFDLKAATKIEFTTVLLGDSSVGKTSLLSRYIFKKYETLGPTLSRSLSFYII